jgi:hypothetical protein
MVTDGDGTAYLANDGTYKTPPIGSFEHEVQDNVDLEMIVSPGAYNISNLSTPPDTNTSGSLYVTKSGDVVYQTWNSDGEFLGRSTVDNGNTWTVWEGPSGSLDDAPSDGTLYGRQDASWVNAEPQVALGTPGQVWATNTAGDGKEWIDIATGLPHFESGDYMTATLGGDNTQRVFGVETDVVYIGPVDSYTSTSVIGRGAWDFQGTGLVPTKQESGVGTQVTNMVQMTQAEYDSITPNETSFYIIVG